MSTKQVKVHAEGFTPDNLELYSTQDEVVFVQGGPGAPSSVHVDNHGLFGTTTCSVGATAAAATVYRPHTPGNYAIGLSPASAKAPGRGTVQVLCLEPTGARGIGGAGTIKVNG